MARLSLSCDQAEKLLEDHKFKIMKKIRGFEFEENIIKIKVKVVIFHTSLKIEFQSFENGVLRIKASTKSLLKVLVKIFIGINKPIDEFLEKEELDEFIKRVEGLTFEVAVNKFLASLRRPKGLTVTDIRLQDGKLTVDADV
jgi:hypothetical protein